MKASKLLILFLSLVFAGINAQEPFYKSYEWGDVPQLPDSVSSEKVILKNAEIIEFIFEGDYFLEYQLRHVVEFINSDEQVQQNNRKYVPFSESSELVEANIRVVNPDEEVLVLDESKILTAVDENTGQNYRYFALEGLEPGSIIDYYYVVRKYPNYNGARKYIQDEFLTEEYNFELYCPDHLEFLFKVYNDTNQVVADTTIKEKRHWILNLKSVEGLKDEESSPYNILLKQLVYKLDKNYGKNSKDLSSLGTASSNIYSNIFHPVDKQDQKALNSFMKEMKLNENLSIDEKISKIEDYVKDNINMVGNNDPTYSKISSIIQLKSATEMGIIRLLIRAYQYAGIDFQVVLTCDRTNLIFDKEFESFHYLTDYLLYFPETKSFIAPDLFEYRYGIIPWELTDNYGLFVKETSLGDYKTGIGKVKYIPLLDYNTSYHNIDATAVIPADFNQVDLTMRMYSMGQYAVYIQPYYNLFNEEIKDEFMKDSFEQYFTDAEIEDWSVENGEARFVGKKPLIQNYNTTTKELIDVAGDKYLFKLGKLIGQQVELYSESERKLPINDRYKRSFTRKLIVEIPEGYIVKNPDDLAMSVDFTKDDKKVLLFESTYSVEGQTITVDIEEYYDQIAYDLSEYESYRKVVNAAADFEKVVLVLEKAEL